MWAVELEHPKCDARLEQVPHLRFKPPPQALFRVEFAISASTNLLSQHQGSCAVPDSQKVINIDVAVLRQIARRRYRFERWSSSSPNAMRDSNRSQTCANSRCAPSSPEGLLFAAFCSPNLSQRIHLSVTFRKSTPPQNRQLIVDYY
jgi:hypothetical protein